MNRKFDNSQLNELKQPICIFNSSWGKLDMWISFLFSVRAIEVYQLSMSCFLIAIDPIFKILKNLSDGSSGFVGARLFHFSKHVFQDSEISQNNILRKSFGFSLII